MSKLKAVIIPGNDDTDISENWFPYVKKELQKHGFFVFARNMPDPKLARKKFWLPFIINELKVDKNTLAIGHSSGAVAILRLLETNKLLGAVIVGACYTDLGDEMEKKAVIMIIYGNGKKSKRTLAGLSNLLPRTILTFLFPNLAIFMKGSIASTTNTLIRDTLVWMLGKKNFPSWLRWFCKNLKNIKNSSDFLIHNEETFLEV